MHAHGWDSSVVLHSAQCTAPRYKPASAYPLSLAGYQLPNVARWPNTGNWTCLPQNYYPETARVAPAYGTVTIDKPFQPGLPVGHYQFKALKAIPVQGFDDGASAGAGGYRIATRWDYTNLPFHPTKNRCDNFNT